MSWVVFRDLQLVDRGILSAAVEELQVVFLMASTKVFVNVLPRLDRKWPDFIGGVFARSRSCVPSDLAPRTRQYQVSRIKFGSRSWGQSA